MGVKWLDSQTEGRLRRLAERLARPLKGPWFKSARPYEETNVCDG